MGVVARIAAAVAVLVDVHHGMKLMMEESFGPVASVIVVEDVEAAIRVANDSDYGLSAAVFTADTNEGLRVARQIQSGICHINGATVHDEPQMPFGGVKDSGYGKFGSRAGLDEFTELRWVTIRRSPTPYPI